MRSAAKRLIIALTLLTLFGLPTAHASHTTAAQCHFVIFSIFDPPIWYPRQPAPPPTDSYSGGAMNIAGNPVKSQVVCSGGLTGVASFSSVGGNCPNLQAHLDGQCNGIPVKPTVSDPVATAIQGSTDVRYLSSEGTLTSDPTAALRDVTTGQQFSSCSVSSWGHTYASAVVELYYDINCGGHHWKGTGPTQFAPFLGPLGDTVHTTPDHPLCRNTNQNTWSYPEKNPVPFISGVGNPNCYRAVETDSIITLSNPSPF